MIIIYNIFIALYFSAIRIISLWNKKAKEWITGRKNLFSQLSEQITAADKIIWVHCASAGELEQGKPVIERLKMQYPDYKVLVTIFSPSGFDPAKKYQFADIISYLPLDTRKNASEFIMLVNPVIVIFIKYDYWYYHLAAIAFHHIPLLLVSAVFRKNQIFFSNYGKLYRQMLFFFRHIFVQDNGSLNLLKEKGIDHCSIGGDTRFDRVKEIAGNFIGLPHIAEFINNNQVIVAGSTWYDDEKALSGQQNNTLKLIIAPHEINENHLKQIEQLFPDSGRYSQWDSGHASKKVLIIDNIGMLSRLYKYGTLTYIGGGFTKDGIHNILEAAVYGKPVLFGPNYKKYREAKELIGYGGAFSFNNKSELEKIINELINNTGLLQKAEFNSRKYIDDNTGATEKVIQFIQANRLLTR